MNLISDLCTLSVFMLSTIYFVLMNYQVFYPSRLWLCTFTLAVSAGMVLLLPISIISNEVLLLHPHSYYVKWLNSSLIHGKSPATRCCYDTPTATTSSGSSALSYTVSQQQQGVATTPPQLLHQVAQQLSHTR